MGIGESLSDAWHALEDKTWSIADAFEDKGVPMASFCDSRGISPAIIIIGIIIAVALLLVFVMASPGGPSGNAIVSVKVVDESGNPVKGQYVVLTTPGGVALPNVKTDQSGKASFDEVPMGQSEISISSDIYSGSKTVDVTSNTVSTTLEVKAGNGKIELVVTDESGAPISVGYVEARTLSGDEVAKVTLDGSTEYTMDVPAGSYYVKVYSNSGGLLKQATTVVAVDGTQSVEFEVSADEANSATVTVIITDETGSAVYGAYIALYNSRNQEQYGAQQMTDAQGKSAFSNIPTGAQVYPTVYVPNDRRYATLDELTAQKDYKTTVRDAQTEIPVTLSLNGRVSVYVRDAESKAAISGAQVTIMNLASESLSETESTNSDGLASFVGFEELTDIYPQVVAQGFLEYDNSQDVRTVRYDDPYITFYADLERDGSAISSEITLNTEDYYNDPISGATGTLSEYGGTFIRRIVADSDSLTFAVDANKDYTVSLWKNAYQRLLLSGIEVGTQTAKMETANSANSATVRVCSFLEINGINSPASSQVELHYLDRELISRAETVGGTDGDNCITFTNVPISWSVYATAIMDGYSLLESDVISVIPVEAGITEINLTFGNINPSMSESGSIKVCALGDSDLPVSGAEVILYDIDLDGPSWSGDYRKTTGSSGCATFEDIPSEKADYEGVLTPVNVYPIITAQDYATFNGKTEGKVVEVQGGRITPINVRLSTGNQICIAVTSGGNPLTGAAVSICGNAQCGEYIETKLTDSDGHAMFSVSMSSISAKAVSNQAGIQAEATENFALSQVSAGSCGTIELEPVSNYASVSIDAISSLENVEPGESSEIKFTARLDGELATGGTYDGQNILGSDGLTKIEIDFESAAMDGGLLREADANDGEYAMPFIAPTQAGNYYAYLTAALPDCDSCGQSRTSVTIVVGYDDEDSDGVKNEYDLCSNTPVGTLVDSNGCPVASSTDTDGDGVPDDVDSCPGTPSGVQVDTYGCEQASSLLDVDNDGYPDIYDAYPQNSEYYYPGQLEAVTGGLLGADYSQMSIQICLIDSDSKEPIYDFTDIKVYNVRQGTSSGANPYRPEYGPTSTPYTPQGQMWSGVRTIDNCRLFMGYESESISQSSMSNFQISASADGYESYSGSGLAGELEYGSSGYGSYMTLNIRLSRSGIATHGGGTIVNPYRKITLKSPSWKAQTSKSNKENIYPAISTNNQEATLQVEYGISSPAKSDLEYSIDYRLKGAYCYEIDNDDGLSETDSFGKRTLTIRSGQSSVIDTVTLKTKSECLAKNDPNLEGTITLSAEGVLFQQGNREAKATKFIPVTIKMTPEIVATNEIRSSADLPELKNKMTLSDGVITSGTLPYCISKTANTADSKLAKDRSALANKIVLEFEAGEAKFTDSAQSIVSTVSKYIIDRLKKTPENCQIYMKILDDYKGHVVVGQSGFGCNDAAEATKEGTKNVQPWEKLFCEAVNSGTTEGMLALGGSYAVELKS